MTSGSSSTPTARTSAPLRPHPAREPPAAADIAPPAPSEAVEVDHEAITAPEAAALNLPYTFDTFVVGCRHRPRAPPPDERTKL
jgi:hypothetical protein